MQRARRIPVRKAAEPVAGYLTVQEFAERFRIARTTVYQAIDTGRLKAIKIFTTKRIPASEAERVEREGL